MKTSSSRLEGSKLLPLLSGKPFLPNPSFLRITSVKRNRKSILSQIPAIVFPGWIAILFVFSISPQATGQISFTSRATGDWNNVNTWVSSNLTGSITTSKNSTAVTGSGTAFMSEIAVGDIICRADGGSTVIGTVASIISNTALILTANAANDNNNANFRKRGVPGAADDVLVRGADNYAITIPTGIDAFCASLTLGNQAADKNNDIIINGTGSLTVGGDLNFHRPNAGGTNDLNIGTGTVSVGGSFSFVGTATNNNRFAKVTITTGTLSISGDLVLTAPSAATPAGNDIDMSGGAGSLNLGGAFVTAAGGRLLPGTSSKFNYNGSAAAQTAVIGVANYTYHHLQFNNTHPDGATLSAAITSTEATGDVSVQNGTLNSGGFDINMGLGKSFGIDYGATFLLAGGSSFINNGTLNNNGSIMGAGTLIQNGIFTNNADIRPGSSPGTLTISGDFDLGSGTYFCELGGTTPGTEYDVLDVSGTATISSATLDVSFINSFSPSIGNTFAIMTFGACSGSFGSTNLPTPPNGSMWIVHYNSTSIVLELALLLPVELTDFRAVPNDANQVNLEWNTESESNNAGFEVQRSSNGEDWETLGFVAGQGNTTEAHFYSFADERPLPGISYYQLRQLDFDGHSTLSEVRVVELYQKDFSESLFLHRSGNLLIITLAKELTGQKTAALFAANGQLLQQKSMEEGISETAFDLAVAPPGIYFLQLKSTAHKACTKIYVP